MASSAHDDPVAMNVIPMVDVIFCLCVFFMCSFALKTREGELEASLPRDRGAASAALQAIPEVSVAVTWDEATGTVERRSGARTVHDDAELLALMRGAYDDLRGASAPDVPLVIDADEHVPWSSVIGIVNLAKSLDVATVQFAHGKKDA